MPHALEIPRLFAAWGIEVTIANGGAAARLRKGGRLSLRILSFELARLGLPVPIDIASGEVELCGFYLARACSDITAKYNRGSPVGGLLVHRCLLCVGGECRLKCRRECQRKYRCLRLGSHELLYPLLELRVGHELLNGEWRSVERVRLLVE